MNKKQKKMLVRILVTFVLFAVLFACEHIGTLEQIDHTWILFLLYLVPYLIIGYDIILKAARNIRNGQVFDENFLMMIATFGAFVVKEFSEAVVVMLFSGGRAVPELCCREVPSVYFRYDGYLPRVREYRRRWETGAG